MKEQIKLRNEQFNAAINQQDGHALCVLYVDEAMLYPPKQQVVQGREAIASFFNAVFKLGISKGNFLTKELLISADYAYESGEYVLLNAENQELAKGFYMYIWQYVEGEWYILKDIWND
ncbi:YybH family protein [Pedobacter gandavensis]|uniref:YybH family protein n=1 Tax=Pedobacter gandavensis TaxID=2679963 RepID=UPI00293062F2|nr:DUF4440 domain-containing protein [Pedobacter gandavensis]